VQAHENFIFAKEEFLNGISIVFSLLIASHSREINESHPSDNLSSDLSIPYGA